MDTLTPVFAFRTETASSFPSAVSLQQWYKRSPSSHTTSRCFPRVGSLPDIRLIRAPLAPKSYASNTPTIQSPILSTVGLRRGASIPSPDRIALFGASGFHFVSTGPNEKNRYRGQCSEGQVSSGNRPARLTFAL